MYAVGILMVFSYAFMGGLQDVIYGHILSETPFLYLVAVSWVTLGITALPLMRLFDSDRRVVLRTHWKKILALNVNSTIAWFTYFYGVKHLEPATVSALNFGMMFMTSNKIGVSSRSKIKNVSTGICLFGLVILSFSACFGYSSLGPLSLSRALFGILASIVCGASITYNGYLSKELQASGFDVRDRLSYRFQLSMVLGLFTLFLSHPHPQSATQAPTLVILAVLLLLIPIWILHEGMKLISNQLTGVLLASTPAFTYFFQIFDSRLIPSFVSLVGVFFCVTGPVVDIILGDDKRVSD